MAVTTASAAICWRPPDGDQTTAFPSYSPASTVPLADMARTVKSSVSKRACPGAGAEYSPMPNRKNIQIAVAFILRFLEIELPAALRQGAADRRCLIERTYSIGKYA